MIEEPDGVAAQAFEAQLKTLHDTLYVDGSLEGGRGSFISCCESDEIAQTFNVSIKGGGDALPKDYTFPTRAAAPRSASSAPSRSVAL